MHYTNGPSVSQIMAYIKLISIDQDVCGAPPNSYPLTHYNVIVCLCKQSSIIATHHYLLQCRLPYMISPLSSHPFVKQLAAVQYSLSVIRSLPRVIVVLNHTLNWALLAVIRLNVNLNPQYDYLVSLESSGYREFHGINPQKSSQHFLPRIATAKTELPDITKNCQFCSFLAFFKIVGPFCHNDILEL